MPKKAAKEKAKGKSAKAKPPKAAAKEKKAKEKTKSKTEKAAKKPDAVPKSKTGKSAKGKAESKAAPPSKAAETAPAAAKTVDAAPPPAKAVEAAPPAKAADTPDPGPPPAKDTDPAPKTAKTAECGPPPTKDADTAPPPAKATDSTQPKSDTKDPPKQKSQRGAPPDAKSDDKVVEVVVDVQDLEKSQVKSGAADPPPAQPPKPPQPEEAQVSARTQIKNMAAALNANAGKSGNVTKANESEKSVGGSGYFAKVTGDDEEDEFMRYKLTGQLATAGAVGSSTPERDHDDVIMREDWRQFRMAEEMAMMLICAKSFEAKQGGAGKKDTDDSEAGLISMAVDNDQLKSMRSMRDMKSQKSQMLTQKELSVYKPMLDKAAQDPKLSANPEKEKAVQSLKEALENKKAITAQDLAKHLATLQKDVNVDKNTLAPMLTLMVEKGVLNTAAIEKITAEIQTLLKSGKKLMMQDVVPILMKHADMSKLKT